MLRSAQTILWFYWKAAPKYECYKGHAGTDKKNKIFYRLPKNFDMWINNRLLNKSNPTGSSPRSRLFITKKRSSHGVIIILADCEWICAFLFLSPISHPLTLLSRSTSDAAADSRLHVTSDLRNTTWRGNCWIWHHWFDIFLRPFNLLSTLAVYWKTRNYFDVSYHKVKRCSSLSSLTKLQCDRISGNRAGRKSMKAASGPVPCERVGGVPGRCLLRPGPAPAPVQCPLLSSVTLSLNRFLLGEGKQPIGAFFRIWFLNLIISSS